MGDHHSSLSHPEPIIAAPKLFSVSHLFIHHHILTHQNVDMHGHRPRPSRWRRFVARLKRRVSDKPLTRIPSTIQSRSTCSSAHRYPSKLRLLQM